MVEYNPHTNKTSQRFTVAQRSRAPHQPKQPSLSIGQTSRVFQAGLKVDCMSLTAGEKTYCFLLQFGC